MTEIKLTPEQNAAADYLAQNLLLMDPKDLKAAILLTVDVYVKAARAKHPDLPDKKIEVAGCWFGNLIAARFLELKKSIGGEGHA